MTGALKVSWPGVGEGRAEAEVVGWDTSRSADRRRDGSLVDVMTDTVTVKLPSPGWPGSRDHRRPRR